MNGIINFIKQWTLPFALVTGSLTYLLFSHVPQLAPVGDTVGPVLVTLMPAVIFVMLYITFCKINLSEFRPRIWHFALQGIRVLLSLAVVVAINLVHDAETKIILQGVFICVICPTAAAAPIVTEKLGGSIASMTVYMIIANVFTSVIIPLLFPMVERSADISFGLAVVAVLRRVLMVLVIPLLLALATRRFLPAFVSWLREKKNLAFYLWAFNLSIVMGLTLRMIINTTVTGQTLVLLLVLPLFVAIALFGIGKLVGGYFGESISGGQALGQKNTIVGIWLMMMFLNPVAVIAPCSYVLWQNMINSLQLWYKDRYGTLKW